jgi:MoxR-like ATPase
MDPIELREQAQRWRARVPHYDEPTGQALVEAATSFEALADTRETATPPVTAPFIHRAFYRR